MSADRRVDERRKAPSYPWFPRDYEFDEDVKLMTYEQEGIYRRLLDHQWFHKGIPADLKSIAILVPKISLAHFRKVWPSIARKFQPAADGRLFNSKLERVRVELEDYKAKKAKAGRDSAAARLEQNGNNQPNRAGTHH